MEMTLEKWILLFAAIAGVITGLFFFQYQEQDTAIVEKYEQEISDEIAVIDLIVDVEEGETEEEVRAYIEENFPGFEIVSISQNENRYLVRIQEVVEE